jgi:hypothetical protein
MSFGSINFCCSGVAKLATGWVAYTSECLSALERNHWSYEIERRTFVDGPSASYPSTTPYCSVSFWLQVACEIDSQVPLTSSVPNALMQLTGRADLQKPYTNLMNNEVVCKT